MSWVDSFRGQVVALDTAPLIYFVERHDLYLPVLRPFFAAVVRGDIQIVTSTLTLTEVLTHPLRRASLDLVAEYSDILLNAPGFEMVPVDVAIATSAAEMRSLYKLETPDAIQLATAKSRRVAALLTNDDDFRRVQDIPTIHLKDIVGTQ